MERILQPHTPTSERLVMTLASSQEHGSFFNVDEFQIRAHFFLLLPPTRIVSWTLPFKDVTTSPPVFVLEVSPM